MKGARRQDGAVHPDHPVVVGADLRPVVVRCCEGGGSVLVLVKVDVAVCDDMRVRLVRIVNVHLRHDGAEDQTWCQRERD